MRTRKTSLAALAVAASAAASIPMAPGGGLRLHGATSTLHGSQDPVTAPPQTTPPATPSPQTPVPQTPLVTAPAFIAAQAAVTRIETRRDLLHRITESMVDAAHAAQAFSQSLAEGHEQPAAISAFAQAAARLRDRAEDYRAAKAGDDDLRTNDGSVLKALDSLVGYTGDEQARLVALRATLVSDQATIPVEKRGVADASVALAEALQAVDVDLGRAIDRIQEAQRNLSSDDGRAVLAGGAYLRTIARSYAEFTTPQSVEDLRAAYAMIKAFDATADTAFHRELNPDIESATADVRTYDPQSRLNAARDLANTRLARLQSALAKGLGGSVDELRIALPEAEATLKGIQILRTSAAQLGPWPGRGKVQQFLNDVDATAQFLTRAIEEARDLTQGAGSTFVAETVSLYYFPDVKRLMLTLNPRTERVDPADLEGGPSGAALLQSRQLALGDAQRSFSLAYADLAQKTNALAAKRFDLENKARLAHQTSDLKTNATRIRTASDVSLKNANDAVTAATAAQATVEADPNATAAQKNAAASRVAAAQKAQQAQQTRSDRDKAAETAAAAKDQANQDVAAQAQKEADALTADIDALTASAVNGARALREARQDVQIAQQDELKAFAYERDNKPFYRAPADSSSQDPAQRVVMYAYDDSKAILLRGPRDAVAQVKDIIAQFDAPTPQARITLWSMDMNVQTSRRGRSSLGDTMQRVDAELLAVREQTSETLRLFRESVNEMVRTVQSQNVDKYKGHPEGERMARLHFFQPEVNRRLGFDPEDSEAYPDRYYFTRWTVPDPASGTTLGETMMMFFLAQERYRAQALDLFEAKMLLASKKGKIPGDRKARAQAFVDRVRQFNLKLSNAPDSLTSEQLEILDALKRSALEKFIANAPSLSRLYDKFYGKSFKGVWLDLAQPTQIKERTIKFDDVSATDKRLNVPMGTLADLFVHHGYYAAGHAFRWDPGYSDGTPGGPSSEEISVAFYIWPVFAWVKLEFGLSPETFEQAHQFANRLGPDATSSPLAEPLQDTLDRRYEGRCLQFFRGLYPRDMANARVAAADEMLKEVMIQFEDALDEAYVQPTLIALRRSLLGDKLDVGQFQRTSLIATNRYVARVAPNASSQLDLAGRTNVQEDAQQLLSFVNDVKTAQIGGIASAIKGLQGKEEAPELYALNGTSSFLVTPVFDPTGQALRFQFDYLKTFNIEAPDGTVNPQLPHVESYPISLPVQISNLELREITRFETNTKLGVPPKTTGGIPILNQLPLLRDLPLVGWFSKRDGKAAVSQQTIILAQTATYPTIADISGLLTGSLRMYLPHAKDATPGP